MSILDQLASAQDRKDEEPNIQLAQDISDNDNHNAIKELVANLNNKNKAISSNCIKVLYEVGERKPTLIADYVDDFVELLKGKNNRLIWGAMTALGSIASLKTDKIWAHVETIIRATENGSAITQDWGIRVLAMVSSNNADYEARILPFLLDFLRQCKPKDLPRHAESVIVTIHTDNQADFIKILTDRKPSLRPSPAKRVDKILKGFND